MVFFTNRTMISVIVFIYQFIQITKISTVISTSTTIISYFNLEYSYNPLSKYLLPTRQQYILVMLQRRSSVCHSNAPSTSQMKHPTTFWWKVATTSQWYIYKTSYWNIMTTSQEDITPVSHWYVSSTSRTSLKLNTLQCLSGTYLRRPISTYLRRLH